MPEFPRSTSHCNALRTRLARTKALLRGAEEERGRLRAENKLMCGANENLVIATLDSKNLRTEAEAANRRKNEFLAMLAHELRNPLAPISMAASILGKIPSPSAEVVKVQEIIERQVSHLSRLLDDLLDAARINSGKITLVRSRLLLADQLLSATETVELCMAERGQHLEVNIPSEDIVLFGDAVRLAQVFSNLLVNASKFTQDGGRIVLSASVVENVAVITVADNGAGIAPEIIPHIFSLFTQGPRSLARSEGGLGVGLNVVQNVAQLHGGTVEVSSPGLGEGSVFTLTLPVFASSCALAAMAGMEKVGVANHRILVIEDNIDANELLSMFLSQEGHTVATALDGPTGLELARSECFDVIICDIGLPGIDGHTLIRALRATTDTNVTFVIGMSGYGQFEDRSLAIAAGFDQYMVKPIEVDALLKLIDAVPARKLHDSNVINVQ